MSLYSQGGSGPTTNPSSPVTFDLSCITSNSPYQFVLVTNFDSSAPAAPTVSIGGTSLGTELLSKSVDRGSEYGTYRYCRLSAFAANVNKTGTQTVSVSFSSSKKISIEAYCCQYVDHINTSSGQGTGTTYCTRIFTASDVGSFSMVAATMNGDDQEVYSSGFSNTTIDRSNVPDTTPSHAIGHELNTSSSVVSGFSWSGLGNAAWWMIGVLADVAPVNSFTLTPTGVTVDIDGGTASLIQSLIMYPTTATITAEGGSTFLIGQGDDFFCDPLRISGLNNGTSWENAFGSIQDMIDAMAANNGDRGFVKAGTIYDIDAVIGIKAGCYIYGGFSRKLKGTEAPIDAREWMRDVTRIDMADCYGVSTPWGCIGTTLTQGLQNNIRIDGFHFSNCDNQIVSPTSTGYGGAIRSDSADNWIIINCVFNTCTCKSNGFGGAIALLGVDDEVRHQVVNCRFIGCGAPTTGFGTGGGGGIGMVGAYAIVDNCSFIECTGGNGSGIMIFGTENEIKIQDCTFYKCDSDYSGDAITIMNNNDSVYIDRCHIMNSLGADSAIRIYSTIANTPPSIFVYLRNSVVAWGAADSTIKTSGADYDHLVIVNCTISENHGYGIVFNGSGSADLCYCYNSIIWDNFTGAISGTLDVCEYNDVKGGYAGTGNINTDPYFHGFSHHEPYELAEVTDCVDGANASVFGYQAVDLVGVTRTGTPDMGAIEYGVKITGGIDCSLYHLDLNSKISSSLKKLSGMSFSLPYLLQESPQAYRGSVYNPSTDPKCYPLWFGSEVEKNTSDPYIVEVWHAQNSGISINRIDQDVHETPSYSYFFPESVQTASFSDSGSANIGAFNTETHGIQHTIYSENASQIFDIITYSVVHRDSNTTTDSMRIYNIWIEQHPIVDKNWEDYIAKFLDSYTDVSETDMPVSSGLMIEFVRLLNLLSWEMRFPMSVPVFGIYWMSYPFGPVV